MKLLKIPPTGVTIGPEEDNNNILIHAGAVFTNSSCKVSEAIGISRNLFLCVFLILPIPPNPPP
jgi:hypothetical protein